MIPYLEVIVEAMIVDETDSNNDGSHLLSSLLYASHWTLYIVFILSSHQPW